MKKTTYIFSYSDMSLRVCSIGSVHGGASIGLEGWVVSCTDNPPPALILQLSNSGYNTGVGQSLAVTCDLRRKVFDDISEALEVSCRSRELTCCARLSGLLRTKYGAHRHSE